MLVCAAAVWIVLAPFAAAQNPTGILIGTVLDEQGGVVRGARVRISSPVLTGGAVTLPTNEKGRLSFPGLAAGTYAIEVTRPGFDAHHDNAVVIAAGATTERTIVLKVARQSADIIILDDRVWHQARHSGLESIFSLQYLRSVPSRRASMFDPIKATPGVSPTSPSGGTVTTVSAFGSGVNENVFLFDGLNTTCPCNGVARSEPGVDFIEAIHVRTFGASAEFGNLQGAVFDVVTRSGSNAFRFDSAFYAQPSALTSQPVRLGPGDLATGYERIRYRDFTTSLGGPAIPQRLWFFAGYQYLRDYDSQPGTDPEFPRTYEQNKIFEKVTWSITPVLRFEQSVHGEFWVNPDPPTRVTPFEATRRRSATVPAMSLGHLRHAVSDRTLWEARVGRFAYNEKRRPSTGDLSVPSRLDRSTNVTTGAPPVFGGLMVARTTAKATLSRFGPAWPGADHDWKIGGEVEKGEQQGANIIPTGVRYEDRDGQPFQAISSAPSNTGGSFITAGMFASDTVRIRDGVTLDAGVRFTHSRAISQDLRALDNEERETGETIGGLGTLYVWNVWSPRLGIAAKLTADGRTMLRASYGRFFQGVVTGEISGFHPGVTPITTSAFETATGGYTRLVRTVDASNLGYDAGTRAPRTDEYSVGVEREIRSRMTAGMAYVHKSGRNFIGWTDIGGQYREDVVVRDGREIPVFALVNTTRDQRFLLSNRPEYSMTYDGLVLTVDVRRSGGWQAFGSYTYSRVAGLQPSSGATAAAPQASTVAAPTVVFGRDPNDLTYAFGRLPNDRPQVFRVAGMVDLARTGILVAGNFQHFSGKPWAASAQVPLPQGQQRVLLEPRGSRRLSSQSLLDLRVSRSFRAGRLGRFDLLLDVLNALNDTAEEGLASDDVFSENFGAPAIFVDPRRVMLSVRFALGR